MKCFFLRNTLNYKTNTSLRLPKPGTHIEALDGLRGIAILLVMMCHFASYGPLQWDGFLRSKLNQILSSGWIGVDLFFVLSGFLITTILLDAKNDRYYFRNFYIRRGLRIFPLYYCFLLAFFFILPRLHWTFSKFQYVENQSLYWSYLINLNIGIHGWPSHYILGHFWTLAIEEQFYLFWPMVIFIFQRKNLVLVCSLFFLGSLVTRMILVQKGFMVGALVLTPSRIDALIMGAFLSIIISNSKWVSFVSRIAWPLFGILTITLIMFFHKMYWLRSDNPKILTIGLTIIPLFFAIILFLSVITPEGKGLNKIFSNRILQFFGRYSYALYIFHQPIVIYLSPRFFSVKTFATMVGSQVLGFIIFSMVVTAISLIFSLLSWYLLESRILGLKRFFPYDTGCRRVV